MDQIHLLSPGKPYPVKGWHNYSKWNVIVPCLDFLVISQEHQSKRQGGTSRVVSFKDESVDLLPDSIHVNRFVIGEEQIQHG